ncbi:hypothetical protein CEXT_628961 [Caerostris extrusa]|uniref:Uncharacterized protein n=1 Tax=Caerostris extrusa TaxID=172846 RepID=A0AAV4N3T0_CAEEX|nr:hypothetical protein CEXT_628961 [Caerostris extrusa]
MGVASLNLQRSRNTEGWVCKTTPLSLISPNLKDHPGNQGKAYLSENLVQKKQQHEASSPTVVQQRCFPKKDKRKKQLSAARRRHLRGPRNTPPPRLSPPDLKFRHVAVWAQELREEPANQ